MGLGGRALERVEVRRRAPKDGAADRRRPRTGGARAGSRRCARAGGRPRRRRAPSLVAEQRVGGAVPGPERDAQTAAAGLDDVALAERHVDRPPARRTGGATRRSRAAARGRRRRRRGGASPRPRRRAPRRCISRSAGSRSTRSSCAATVHPERARTSAAWPTWSECWWVSIEELDVLEAEAERREARLERRERLRRVRAGVDERQRLAPEHPAR